MGSEAETPIIWPPDVAKLIGKANSLEKTSVLGKMEGRRRGGSRG